MLDLLEEALLPRKGAQVTDVVLKNLQASGPRDVEELLAPLEERCGRVADETVKKLAERGKREADAMREILESQRKRIAATVEKYAHPQQSIDFDEEEKRQLEANQRHWDKRLAAIDHELETESDRIRALYDVKARQIEPVGLVYLWPVTG